ncbi:hypothetical protein E2C01_032459 [Portunus trituberculatus]|uniref:Uncharacterized protein n=1 Tax=Portunus trituberculatus TaxID=210409 RepID=A0A5B7EW21_PORTR|nr:hypothetical protein [Portunus trituberculatus]
MSLWKTMTLRGSKRSTSCNHNDSRLDRLFDPHYSKWAGRADVAARDIVGGRLRAGRVRLHGKSAISRGNSNGIRMIKREVQQNKDRGVKQQRISYGNSPVNVKVFTNRTGSPVKREANDAHGDKHGTARAGSRQEDIM